MIRVLFSNRLHDINMEEELKLLCCWASIRLILVANSLRSLKSPEFLSKEEGWIPALKSNRYCNGNGQPCSNKSLDTIATHDNFNQTPPHLRYTQFATILKPIQT